MLPLLARAPPPPRESAPLVVLDALASARQRAADKYGTTEPAADEEVDVSYDDLPAELVALVRPFVRTAFDPSRGVHVFTGVSASRPFRIAEAPRLCFRHAIVAAFARAIVAIDPGLRAPGFAAWLAAARDRPARVGEWWRSTPQGAAR